MWTYYSFSPYGSIQIHTRQRGLSNFAVGCPGTSHCPMVPWDPIGHPNSPRQVFLKGEGRAVAPPPPPQRILCPPLSISNEIYHEFELTKLLKQTYIG